MKLWISAIALIGYLALGAPDLRAQMYGPYYVPYWEAEYQQYLHYQNYLQWQQHLDYLRHFDPYYQLHLLHYQLYLAPYQPYHSYLPCCYVSSFSPLSGPSRVPFGTRSLIPYGVMRR